MPDIISALPNQVEVNGVRLSYVEHGSGEPILFVHGAFTDLRAWEPIKEAVAKHYRSIAYTQRYFGTDPWPDDGNNFSVATHADDLARFIILLNIGPVHLVGWSYGGVVATAAAVKNPSLVRSLILYEPGAISVIPTEGSESKMAHEDWATMLGPAVSAAKAGDSIQAARLLQEAVFQLPPGGSGGLPQDWQAMVLDNARTVPPMLGPRPVITCEMLKNFSRPTLVMRGAKSRLCYLLISEALSRCVPGARQVVLPNVNHDGPLRDPAGFSAAVLEFLSKRSGF